MTELKLFSYNLPMGGAISTDFSIPRTSIFNAEQGLAKNALFYAFFEPAPNGRHCFFLIDSICKPDGSRASGREGTNFPKPVLITWLINELWHLHLTPALL